MGDVGAGAEVVDSSAATITVPLTVDVSGLGEPSFFDIDSSDIPSVFRFDPGCSFALPPKACGDNSP